MVKKDNYPVITIHDSVPLIGNAILKTEIECHGKLGCTLGQIQEISIMRKIYICYISSCIRTQTVEPNLT